MNLQVRPSTEKKSPRIMQNGSVCRVCGKSIRSGYLCTRHRKSFIYNKKYGFVHLKVRRKVSKLQQNVFLALRSLRTPCFQEVIFDWYPRARYDIYAPEKNLILEVDGPQHFKVVKFFDKSLESFTERVSRDRIKMLMAEQHGIRVMRVNYKQAIDGGYLERFIKQF